MLAGFLGGLLGPLIGVGGGVVVVPLLHMGGLSFQEAVSASLFSIVVTSAVSVYNYRRLLSWRDLAPLTAASSASSAVAALLAVRYGGSWVELAYGCYLVAIGLFMLSGARASARRPLLGVALAFVGGLASSLFGVGGGTVFVPALMLTAAYDAKLAAASSMGMILPTAALATATYMALGHMDWPAALLTAAGSFCGSFLASRYIMPRLASGQVRRLFTAYVFAVGIYYLWRAMG